MTVRNIDDVQKELGEALIASGKLDRSGLDRAMRLLDQTTGHHLPDLLTKLGLVQERDLAAAIARQLGLRLIASSDIPQQPLEIEHLSPRFLKTRRMLPIADTPDGHFVAMADPLDSFSIEAFSLATERPVVVGVAEPALIESAIERLYSDQIGDVAAQTTPDTDSEDIDVERLRDLASEAPVVQLVNSLVARAVEARASDIHFESYEHEFRVRYRIDGVLQEPTQLPERLRPAVISRLKIMARLDIAEHRLPQDGRVKTVVRGKPVDIRVSTLPVMYGESVVLRLLDRDAVALDFDKLGVQAPARDRLDEILQVPHGIFVVTGPTGSGKTTTLYAALSAINEEGKKLVTVEDPVEYQLEGVNQVPVKPSIGLTFANVLRSILRQDPDIIMVGEIRDGDTARIAAQAALTGHLVLSTLHTNDAASAITRFLDMGIEDYLLTSTLEGVAAQRLVRRLCPSCREPYAALPEVIEQFGLRRFSGNGESGEVTLYKARGCDECRGQGYLGRIMLVEVLTMSDHIRSLILRHAEAQELHRAAVAEGMRTMFEDGLAKVVQGVTTLEEVIRSTGKG
ncbi:ATPase, T2SS/T4P/T4SS family [Marimonas arenosa]|uniref:ATPase, T2SS/T4P/T4SS family n=2 Tax=Marimonas arenosa TaxID=1795305 RepID=A0AAE4B4A4_9RHOB|nr:ATPase, T2SS/T4P/T4SS family [Marimonas arenosa]